MVYKNPCVKCGLCCISQTCPIGMRHFRVKRFEPCPGLSFDEIGLANCALAGSEVPVGDGCCIKARALSVDGSQVNFADLPTVVKINTVNEIRKGKIGLWSKIKGGAE